MFISIGDSKEVSRKVLWHEYDKNWTFYYFWPEVLKTRIVRLAHSRDMPGFHKSGHISEITRPRVSLDLLCWSDGSLALAWLFDVLVLYFWKIFQCTQIVDYHLMTRWLNCDLETSMQNEAHKEKQCWLMLELNDLQALPSPKVYFLTW